MKHHQQLMDIAGSVSLPTVSLMSNNQSSLDTFCIGDLEHDLHNTFAATRVPSSSFVYCSHGELDQTLDNYCDNASLDKKTNPLVISGHSGLGKSALLANWLLKHQAEIKRSKTMSDEFIFWHVVGCSRQSTYTYHTLRRLMNELKDHFELTAAVPDNDEKLPWDLPRFLELSAKRGRVLIIIDGLHRLRSEEGDIGLKWLPLSFPENARVIISTTSPGGEEDEDAGFDTGNAEDDAIGASEGKKERVLQVSGRFLRYWFDEFVSYLARVIVILQRRCHRLCFSLYNSALLPSQELKRRNWKIMEMGSLPKKTSKDIVDRFLQLSSKTQSKQRRKEAAAKLSKAQGQKTFLTAGDDSGTIEEELDPHLEKALVLFPSLKQKILDDQGASNSLFLRTLLNASEYAANYGYDLWQCIDKWMEGADGVNRLYDEILETFESGHAPSGSSIDSARAACEEDGGFQALLDENPWNPSLAAMVGSSKKAIQADSNVIDEGIKASDDDEIIQERLMKEASLNADERLSLLKKDAEQKLENLFSDIVHRVSRQNKEMSGNDFLAWLDTPEGRDAIPGYEGATVPGSGEVSASLQEEVEEEEVAKASSNQDGESKSGDGGKDSDDDDYDDYEDDDYEDDDEYEDEFEDENEDKPSQLQPKGSNLESLSLSHSSSKLPTFAEEKARRQAEEARKLEETVTSKSRSRTKSFNSSEGPGANDDAFDSIPVYLKGGTKVRGLGRILGYALALLYVSRHGLKESELFDLLVRIKEQDDLTKSTKGTELAAEMKIFKVMAENKTRLIDTFRRFDKDNNHVVSYDEFRAGVKSLHLKDVSSEQIEMLIVSLDKNNDGNIDFNEAIERFEDNARLYSHGKLKLEGEESSLDSNSLSNDKKSAIADIDMNFLNDSTISASAIAEKTLGADVEKALLKALIYLGVIYAPRDKVLMLPLESEALREVVWWRYVGSAEGQAKWHGHIIQFFMEKMPSLRRCEELPWHLSKCRRWTALKDTLVDLRTFDIMYNGNQLRGELFNYWRNLIEGPLYISEEDEEKGYKSQIEFPEKNDMLLEELDVSSKLGLSDSQVRKERLRGQMAPFDIVDEHNRAVEMWHSGISPSTARLEKMISNISEFMAWFSENMNATTEPPPFLRKTMNYEQLRDIGVEQSDVLNKLSLLSHGDSRKEEGDEAEEKKDAGSASEEKAKSKEAFFPEKYNIGAPGMLKPQYYYFNRWIWIMFPWIALKNAALYSEQMRTIGSYDSIKAVRKGSLLSAEGDESDSELNQASKKSGSKTAESKANDQRFWDVKKINPRAAPKSKTSSSRDQAMITSEAGKVSAANRMFDRLSEENRVLGIAPREKIKPPRMNLEPAAKGSIPFSYSSVKSQKSGSRFPSVDKFYKMQVEQDEQAMDAAAASAIERFGGQEQPQTLVELMDMKQAEEMPCSASNGGDLGYLPAHSLTFPTTNDDALLAQAFAKAGKMREIYDKLKMESKRKSEKLQDMRRTADERERKDEETHKNMMAGEEHMEQLQLRLDHMNDAVKNAHFLGEFHVRIQEVMLSNPAKDKNHLDSLEQQLNLARQQLRDMLKRRNALRTEKEVIEKKEQPRYKNEIKKARIKRMKIEPQLEQKRKELQQQRNKMDVSGAGKSTLDDLFRGHSADPSPGSSRPASSQAAVKLVVQTTPSNKLQNAAAFGGLASLTSAMASEAGEYKKNLMLSCMEKLEDAAGTTDGDELVEKFEQTKKLATSLNAQKKFHEHKVQKLKDELSELQKELDELQFAGEEAGADKEASTDVRKMDTITNKAEMRCSHIRKKLERGVTLIHFVKTGIVHLKRLVEDMDAVVKLPVTKVHSHILEEEGIDEHVKILTVTEDKLTGLIEFLTLGSSKQLGDDRSLSIAEKQSEIADTVFRAKLERIGEEEAEKKYRPRSRGGVLEEKTNPKPNADYASLSSPEAIRISVLNAMDTEYDKEMKHIETKQDRRMDLDEAEILAADNDIGKEEMVKFIGEALNTRESRMEQRKAHVLSESKRGNHKDLGITMDTVLSQQEARLAKEGPVALANIKKSKKSPRSAIAVHDRGDLKKISRKVVRGKEKERLKEEKEEQRKLAAMMAE